VNSSSGTALRLVDRMAGPGETFGSAGETDGRIDAFLDRGSYQIVAEGAPKARGEAKLSVRPFSERPGSSPVRLVEGRPIDDRLADFEELGWWLEIETKHRVEIEAAGRCLADLRLWVDGSWLHAAAPTSERIEPLAGRPLNAMRISAELEPGLYRLAAYGGPPLPWAAGGDEAPFHLRTGTPLLPKEGRRRLTIGPFGLERFRVPGKATFFRISLAEARPAELLVSDRDPEHPFAGDGDSARIEKSSNPPEATLRRAPRPEPGDEHLLVVRGEPGETLVLEQFEERERARIEEDGSYWIATVHSGAPGDQLDASAILSRRTPAGRDELVDDRAIPLGKETAWQRRGNLTGPAAIFLRVEEGGRYVVESKGTEARFRIEPFATNRPNGYEEPPMRGGGSTWDLDPGLHVLSIEPVRKGIADLVVRHQSSKAGPPASVVGSIRFPAVDLDRTGSWTLTVAHRPEVVTGIVMRRLPLDLGEPLSLTIRPPEQIEIPFAAGEDGVLRAEAEDGKSLEISVDGAPFAADPPVAAGTHRAVVRSDGQPTRALEVAFLPRRLGAASPLPPLPDGAFAALPDFPELSPDKPRHLDLQQESAATFRLTVSRPALHSLRSTGLLATGADLRTRTVPSFRHAEENGSGRNFLLDDYLREGEYQLTVRSRGATRGHLGVEAGRTPLGDGGSIFVGSPARAELEAGQALLYRFRITSPGNFRIRATSLRHRLRCRLEDAKGWPIEKPGIDAELVRRFEPGDYRLVVLPEAVETRVLTMIESLDPRPRIAGHGPHPLPIGRERNHVWNEPDGDAPREPDVWLLDLAAPATATFSLPAEMDGEIRQAEAAQGTSPVAKLHLGRGWRGKLEADRYRIELRAARRNNRLPYSIRVDTDELVPGSDRQLESRSVLPLSIGRSGLVEIASFGESDVAARLFDGSGRLVDANDDRPGDWNFLISRSLEPGLYRLEVAPAGGGGGPFTVAVSSPKEVDAGPLPIPASLDLRPGREARLWSVEPATGPELLVFSASSAENVSLAVERLGGGRWEVLGTASGRAPRIEIPSGPEKIRLRLWSIDRRRSAVRLEAARLVPPARGERSGSTSVDLAPLPAGAPVVRAARIDSEGAGLFRIDGPGELRGAAGAARLEPPPFGVVVGAGGPIWLAADAGRSSGQARIERIRLAPGRELRFVLAAGGEAHCDLASSKSGGPRLLSASSRSGQPGVAFGPKRDGRRLGVGDGESVTFAPAGDAGAVSVWNAVDESPLELTLALVDFPPSRRSDLRQGRTEGSIEAGESVRLTLPAGSKRLRVVAGAGLVAALGSRSEAGPLFRRSDAPLEATVDSDAAELTILNPTPGSASWLVDLVPLPLEGRRALVTRESAVEQRVASSGLLALPVSPVASSGADVSLRVLGMRGEAIWIGAGGRVARGDRFDVDPSGGLLLVPHDPGFVFAGFEPPRKEETKEEPAPTELPLPALVRFRGESVRSFVLGAESERWLRVRGSSPLRTRLLRGAGGPGSIAIHPEGAHLDAWLPAGRSILRFEGLAGEPLVGEIELSALPVRPAGEGLGEEALLASGDSVLYSFRVDREGGVGIGVRASAGSAEASLFSADGKLLGNGVAWMPELRPGTYLLGIASAPDQGPIRVRPALVGLVPPPTGPPEEVLRSYLEPEGAPAGFTSRRASETAIGWRGSGEEGEADFDGENPPEPEPSGDEGEGVEENGDGGEERE
jgi:hypothetical protein